MTIKPACAQCGYIHSSGDIVLVGRFQPTPAGYRAPVNPDSVLRPTRELAENDLCQWRIRSNERGGLVGSAQ